MKTASLTGLSFSQLENLFPSLPRFRILQIYKWLTRGISDFDRMSDIPNSLREELKKNFSLYSGAVDGIYDDRDAKKIAVALKDGLKIEAVLLNDGKNRLTACLSTQAGCPVGCVFCKTGSLGFSRNLTGAEIVEQFIFLRNTAQKFYGAEKSGDTEKSSHIIENIVIMGMGEPLLNMENLRGAVSSFTDPAGINFSRRRITVSTCGICSSLFDIAENGPAVRFALSLTTADEPLRQKLMPITTANPLKKVKEALTLFQRNGGGRVTLETVLLGGINTRDEDALSIADFARSLDAVVNIIPWNPVAGLEFEGKPLREPETKEIENFTRKLESLSMKVTKRLRKGRGIMGACGQLGSIEDISHGGSEAQRTARNLRTQLKTEEKI
jgi:23S rRNA (adenine2503-C2)-methyltransferase